LREGNPIKLIGMPQRQPAENDSIPKIAPKWLKFDRAVINCENCLGFEI
jgi:hypothetical protein